MVLKKEKSALPAEPTPLYLEIGQLFSSVYIKISCVISGSTWMVMVSKYCLTDGNS